MRALFLLVTFIGIVWYSNAQTNQYFPSADGSEWEHLPIDSLNWCQNKVNDMVDFVEENNSKAFIILKDGKIVVEEYFDEFSSDSLWYWASAGKTLASFTVGMAEANGEIDLDASTSDYLGEGWTGCTPEQEAEITVWNQLTMTSGLDDSQNENCTTPECLTFLAEPGTRWAYHNAPYTLIQSVLEEATGVGINTYMFQNLLPTTGIFASFIPVEDNSVAFSTPRSMARFGHLLLNEGVWNGTNLLGNSSFFEEMVSSSQNLNQSYGYLTWLNGQDSYMLPGFQFELEGSLIPNAPDDMFSALGKNDQIIDVVPSSGLVVIRMGNHTANLDLVPINFNNDLWEHINDLECTDNVNEHNEAPLNTYPNPAVDRLHVEGHGIVRLSLLDNSGRIVKTVSLPEMDISAIKNGSYVLRIETNDSLFTKKVIVSH